MTHRSPDSLLDGSGHASDDGFSGRSALVREAYEVASAAHAAQVQDNGSPYMDHVLAVARLVEEAGFDDVVVAAAFLHDVVEHSDLGMDDLRERFGEDVTALVAAMTEPADVEPFDRRKAAHREQIAAAGRRAEVLFAADKVANASSLRHAIVLLGEAELDARLPSPVQSKIDHYRATLEQLADLVGPPLAKRLRDELWRLDQDRAAAADIALGRRAYEAFAGCDPEVILDLCAEDVEWTPGDLLGAGDETYRGREGVRRYFAKIADARRQASFELRDLGAREGRVIVIYVLTVGEHEQEAAIVYEARDGKIARADTHVEDLDAIARRLAAP